ncbi:MAG TPA: cohesin domain-containing protein [Candidatus Saccharimonadales bacterium]|nr:cohesin domain-containing protein [Candidatus Saccharimonadales bacterium]
MARIRLVAPRTIWIASAIVALLVILAGVLLSRSTFRADQPSLSIYMDPSTRNVAANDEFDTQVKLLPTSSTIMLGAQLVINYDSTVLNFETAAGGSGFEGKNLENQTGQISWLVVPTTQLDLVAGRAVVVGTLRFKALKTGSAQITFTQDDTLAAALDSGSRPSMFNGITSYQNALVSVNGENPTPVTLPLVQPATNQANRTSSSQRLESIQAIPLYDSALITVGLTYQSNLRIDFGDTDKLGSSLAPVGNSSNWAVKLLGLKPSTQYYYKVTAINADKTSEVSSSLKSFTTVTSAPDSTGVARAQLITSAPTAKESATVFLIATDDQGRIITGLNPTFQVQDGQADFSTVDEVGGLYQADLTTKLTSAQTVTFVATAGGKQIAQATQAFDPNYLDKQIPVTSSGDIVQPNRVVLSTLVGLLAGLVLLGLLFVRLARAK